MPLSPVHSKITSCRSLLPSSPFSLYSFLSTRFASNSARSEGLKVYKPITPGQRGRVTTSRKDLWKGGPFKALTKGMRKTGGRNNHGRITSRHRGGGHRRLYRFIDFHRQSTSPPGVVERIEYDPNRSARIALLQHKQEHVDGEDSRDEDAKPQTARKSANYSYVLAPQNLSIGDELFAGPDAPIKTGNAMPLSAIPVGMQIHNVELRPGGGGQLARAAGTSCTLIKKGSDGYAVVRLPSGEQRLVLQRCMATIGVLSNPLHKNRKLGKAGARRWLGRRPKVRGIAMNPVDHPHGGGRGKSKGRISQTPWGKPTKGYRTRHNPRTDWSIWLSRHKAKR